MKTQDYVISCDVCGRRLGTSSKPQKGFTCGAALVTHANGEPIAVVEKENTIDALAELDALKRLLISKNVLTDEELKRPAQ